jgi:hypothetical protein
MSQWSGNTLTTNIKNAQAVGHPLRFAMICLLVVGCIVAGIWSSVLGIESLQSSSWPQAEATIDSFRFFEQQAMRGGGMSYGVDIHYSFQVDGVTYQGYRFNTRDNYIDHNVAIDDTARAAISSQYLPGSICSVSHDPHDPTRSFIDPTVTVLTWIRLVIGVLFAISGPTILDSEIEQFVQARKQRIAS